MWFSNLSPFETYLVALPAVMFGSILFLAGIILMLEPRNKNDAETLEAIRKALEKAGAKFNGVPTETDKKP
jgi:hypothetical protein